MSTPSVDNVLADHDGGLAEPQLLLDHPLQQHEKRPLPRIERQRYRGVMAHKAVGIRIGERRGLEQVLLAGIVPQAANVPARLLELTPLLFLAGRLAVLRPRLQLGLEYVERLQHPAARRRWHCLWRWRV